MPLKCLHCFQNEEEEVQHLCYQHCMLTDVPAEVFSYERTLEELYLDANRIKDLPRALFHCHGLKVLSLSDNDIQNLPPAVASLISLRYFDISRNALGGIPDNIKCCKQLYYVDVSINPLEKLPEGFTQLINLEELYLNDTCLDFLPANFGRLTKLKILELRENNLNILPKSIVRLSNLERLDIGQNDFSTLPEVIGSLVNLTELWVDCNRIRSIPAIIGNLKKLTHFDASNNNIDRIAPEIERCERIVDLTLSSNELQEIPSTLGYIKELVTLKLDDNQIQSLPNTIGKLTKLEELVLSHNDLSSLPPNIGLLRKLYSLNVDDNGLEELPSEIGSCSSLAILSARNNKLQEIPSEIGYLPKIKVLNFSDNFLRNLPVSILNLSYLSALWLASNQSTPLMALQKEFDKKTGQTVCINFSLPQLTHDKYQNDHNEEEESPVIRLRPHIRFAPSDVKGEENSKLTRAPTPYPKELRAMAKHVKVLQQNALKLSEKINEDKSFFGEVISNEPKNMMIKKAVVKKPSSVLSGNNVNDNCSGAETSHVESVCNGSYQDSNHLVSKEVGPVIREAKLIKPMLSSAEDDRLEYASSKYSRNFSKLQDIPTTFYDSEYPTSNKPPPYHIAAAYSKQAIWFEQSHPYKYDDHAIDTIPTKNFTSNTSPTEHACEQDTVLVDADISLTQKDTCEPAMHSVSDEDSGVHSNKKYSNIEGNLINRKCGINSSGFYNPMAEYTSSSITSDSPKKKSVSNPSSSYFHGDQVNETTSMKTENQDKDDSTSCFSESATSLVKENSNDYHNCYVSNSENNQIEFESQYSSQFPISDVPYLTKKNINNTNRDTFLSETFSPHSGEGPHPGRELHFHNSLDDSSQKRRYEDNQTNFRNEETFVTVIPKYDCDACSYESTCDRLSRHTCDLEIKETVVSNSIWRNETENSKVNDHDVKDVSNNNYGSPVNDKQDVVSEESKTFKQQNVKSSLLASRSDSKMAWMFGHHKNVTVFQVVIRKNPGLGFNIGGGCQTNFPEKQGIFITKIHSNGPAVGFVCEGDKILEVDGIDLSNMNQEEAVHIFNNTGNTVHMMISRQQY